jgi:tocopherol cyclase
MNKSDLSRDAYMLHGRTNKRGYDWWWHNFTAIDEETGEEKPFFVEFYVINPKGSPNQVLLGQDPQDQSGSATAPFLRHDQCRHVGQRQSPIAPLFSSIKSNAVSIGIKKRSVLADCLCTETTLKGSSRSQRRKKPSNRAIFAMRDPCLLTFKSKKEIPVQCRLWGR